METLYIEEKDGKRRRAETAQCLTCNKDFLRRLKYIQKRGGPSKYCSVGCRGKGKRTRQPIKCSWCDKPFERTPSKLKNATRGFSFCSQKCKSMAQRLENNFKEVWPDHYKNGSGKNTPGTLIERTKEPKCASCSETRRYVLLVHHIDGDRKNNKLENLEIVCANCHLTRHLIKKNGEWRINNKSLTPRNLLGSL